MMPLRVMMLGAVAALGMAGAPPVAAQTFDGVYRLTPLHSGKAVDVAFCGTTGGTNVRQWSWLDNDCQKWRITPVDGVYHRLSPLNAPNQALDIDSFSTANGANAMLWDWLGGVNQQFRFEAVASGGYRIVARNSGKCLDVYALSTADGANLVQWDCIGVNDNQVFALEAQSDPGSGDLVPVDQDGPWSATIDEDTGPGGEGWVGRPANLGEDGMRHPILVWGPGAGTGPEDYAFFLERMATHGFVVYSEVSSSGGQEMEDALNWLIAENGRPGSPYYQTLDTGRVAFGGHSRGSIATFANGSDSRLTTTIHVAGGSFDGEGPDSLQNPTLYVGGTDDFATPNLEDDYAVTEVPVFFTVLDGTDHISAARDGMPVITAWLRWQLYGEERREQFIAPDCTFCVGVYDSRYKNW